MLLPAETHPATPTHASRDGWYAATSLTLSMWSAMCWFERRLTERLYHDEPPCWQRAELWAQRVLKVPYSWYVISRHTVQPLSRNVKYWDRELHLHARCCSCLQSTRNSESVKQNFFFRVLDDRKTFHCVYFRTEMIFRTYNLTTKMFKQIK